MAAEQDGVTTFPLACTIDGVQVIARVEVDAQGVTIEPFPGQPPRIEMAAEAWKQIGTQVLVAAHSCPPSGGRAQPG